MLKISIEYDLFCSIYMRQFIVQMGLMANFNSKYTKSQGLTATPLFH